MGLVKQVYVVTAGWPREEIYGLTSQVRRAAVSIPTNIAEGVGRGTPGEQSRFAQIALGSAYELGTLLQIAADLEYLDHPTLQVLQTQNTQLSKRISSYIAYKDSKR